MKLLRNKRGQGMSEYLIILALVAIATIGAVIFFADNVREQISNLADEIAGQDVTPAADTAFEATGRGTFDMANYTQTDAGP